MRELSVNEKEMLKDIIEEMRECKMFEGHYDAKNGQPEFMYGISTVMEYLAYMVSDEYGDSFSNTFFHMFCTSLSIIIITSFLKIVKYFFNFFLIFFWMCFNKFLLIFF